MMGQLHQGKYARDYTCDELSIELGNICWLWDAQRLVKQTLSKLIKALFSGRLTGCSVPERDRKET